MTSNVDRVYPSEALVMLEGMNGKAMADRLTTVSKSRLGDLIGHLDGRDMEKIEHAIVVQLGLLSLLST